MQDPSRIKEKRKYLKKKVEADKAQYLCIDKTTRFIPTA